MRSESARTPYNAETDSLIHIRRTIAPAAATTNYPIPRVQPSPHCVSHLRHLLRYTKRAVSQKTPSGRPHGPSLRTLGLVLLKSGFAVRLIGPVGNELQRCRQPRLRRAPLECLQEVLELPNLPAILTLTLTHTADSRFDNPVMATCRNTLSLPCWHGLLLRNHTQASGRWIAC